MSEHLTESPYMGVETSDLLQRLRATRFADELAMEALREIERLCGCLKTANSNTEEFERKFYLEQDRAESAERERDESRAENARLLAELVALRERIEKAPIADTEVEYIDENTRIVWLKDEAMPDDFSGKRVRLLVEE